MKYYIKTFLFFLILSVLSVSCADRAVRYDGPTIIRASIGDASYLNPVLSSDSASSDINNLVFNGLVKYDKDLVLTGDLAKDWEVSEDMMEIKFYLRDGVKWHDGEYFTASDVIFTYETIICEKTRTPHSSRFDKVDSVTSPRPGVVVVEYEEPFSPSLESWGMGIIPKHLYEGTDVNTNEHNRNPVGTGPYKFVSWRTDDRIILEANPYYFEGEPQIRRFIYNIIPDVAVQFMELEKGTVDWMSPTPDQWMDETGSEEFLKKFNRFRYPSLTYTYMGYNLRDELFREKEIRQAINYAVDKEEIIDAVMRGLATKATGPYPPNMWAHNPDVQEYGYNPEKADRLLKSKGWRKNKDTGIREKNGEAFSFTLMTNQGNTERKLISEIIQQQLGDIGIEVNVRVQEWSSFINQYIDKREFDAVILGWSITLDPDQYSIWHSSQKEEGMQNFAGYSNSRVDELIEKGRRTFDKEKRKKIYREKHRILQDEQPYMFLYYPDSRVVVDNRFKNIKLEKSGIMHNFIDWYVPEHKRKY